eukprot:514314-Rhodomonas_salina.2
MGDNTEQSPQPSNAIDDGLSAENIARILAAASDPSASVMHMAQIALECQLTMAELQKQQMEFQKEQEAKRADDPWRNVLLSDLPLFIGLKDQLLPMAWLHSLSKYAKRAGMGSLDGLHGGLRGAGWCLRHQGHSGPVHVLSQAQDSSGSAAGQAH